MSQLTTGWLYVFTACLLFLSATNAALANGIDLRIHPIGDSITDGYKSSDGNGYRQNLLNKLNGNSVRFIGSSHSGNMANNANDGWSGYEINEIAGKIGPALKQRPNVALVMAGTNDINRNDNVGSAPDRLGNLLDQITTACPDAVIILAKITPIKDSAAESRSQTYNAAIEGVAQSRIKAGKKIVVIDMQNSQNGLSVNDLNDGLHPNDNGYAKMANVWYDGLNTAAGKGWITAPVAGAPITSASACTGSLFWYNNHGTVASGVGSSDGFFTSGWNPVGQVASGIGEGAGVRIADIDGDGVDDYIWIDPKSGAATLYINGGYSNGKINWQPKGVVASGLGDGAGVRFADIDGDGKADYIWIDKNGAVTAYRNGGPKSGGGWVWIKMNSITNAVDVGTRDSIIFADINGDGRADYSILGDGGSLKTWIASGQSPEPTWLPLGHIASGIGDAAGVRLADLNGNGRADYIWINDKSASYAYINQRSMDNLAPIWIDAKQLGSGVGANRSNILFGDLTGDGKDDFLIVNSTTGAIDMYINQGKGGSYQAGDLVTFADLDGDGLDDYVSVGPNGALLAYQNGGDKGNGNWLWINWGTIASGVARRDQIRLADLNGDGKADYIYLDDKTGAASVYINGGRNPQDSSKWIWYPNGKIASGIGFPGRAIHFADIDGDGKADYLAVDTKGAVTAYLNGGPKSDAPGGWLWYPIGEIASGVGQGSEIRFADIDGDGLADYLVVSQSRGVVTEYKNGGQASGGKWIWYPKGSIASGVGATGDSVVFGAVSSHRADYLVITPSTGAVYMWANGCDGTVGGGGSSGGGSGGDSGDGSGLFDPDGGDIYPDNWQQPFDPNYYAACNEVYTNIDDVNKKQDSIPPNCINKYVADALIAMWTDAMHKYDDLINGGYDDKFKYYAGYVTKEVPVQIDAFMSNGHADDFFDCSEHRYITCCKDCKIAQCAEDCSRADPCTSGEGDRKIKCPTVFANGRPELSFTGNAPNTTFKLKDGQGFYKAIEAAYGITKDWLNFEDQLVILANGCQFAGTGVNDCEKKNGIWFWQYPAAGNVKISDPKDIVSKTRDSSQDILKRLKIMQMANSLDGLTQEGDLVDGGAIPALAVLAAIDAMGKVAEAGAEIKEEERKEQILMFVTAILFFIPFVGEAAGAAGLAATRLIIELIGVAGDIALGTYGVVSDPNNAFATILTTLIGAGIGRGGWRNAAGARRGMKPEDIAKLGSIKDRLGTISGARVRMCKL